MQLSSIMCRAQEAQQRARAASTTLDNVRTLATIAAAAWHKEALAADRRERRRPPPVLDLQMVWDDRTFSENPDRGQA
ncbi:MAG: hypothetical protein EOP62_00550 [Sphingomonadales bacterium]|nr:MAG: hypothetical protein EOP62_00550 [Sphingomonadales bacterium]